MIPQYLVDYIVNSRCVTRQHSQVSHGYVYVLVTRDLFKDTAMQYIEEALSSGAKYIVISNDLYMTLNFIDEVHIIPVENVAKVWGFIASLLYKDMPHIIVGITGTSGKTSIAYMYSQMMAMLKKECLYVGTLGAMIIKSDLSVDHIENTLTTPDAMDLHRILNGYDNACIEVSSHGIDQNRIHYIPFTVAGFSNLSHEHLDYHHNIENYYKVKESFFLNYNVQKFVLNTDDFYSRRIIDQLSDENVLTYGSAANASLMLIDYLPSKMIIFSYEDQIYSIRTNILGEYNIYNFLCAIGMMLQSGFTINEILRVASNVKLPEGRLEKIVVNGKNVFIDYAHKPDALKKVLIALRELNDASNIWTVFGCGGNRDSEKRPIMGQIASELSDVVIVTDDNPRNELPEKIRKEIISGISSCKYFEIENRKTAIKYAVNNAKKNDIILIAGKGHEKYQIIGNQMIEFSDCDIVKSMQI